MTRRLLCFLALFCLLAQPVRAEEPLTLPACQTVEEVLSLILWPDEGAQPVAAERGTVRYISQDTIKDPDFCPEYWYGGEPGSDLDLTMEVSKQKGRFNQPYTYYARNMCTRAVYSMALSYLGVDLTPGAMSALLNKRDINMHYDEITDQLPEVESGQFSQDVFFNMFKAYQEDSRYSPVYLYIRRPDNTTHCLLVVAQQEDGRYIVIDPKYHNLQDESILVYTIAFNKFALKISASDFRNELKDCTVLKYCQWRLVEPE